MEGAHRSLPRRTLAQAALCAALLPTAEGAARDGPVPGALVASAAAQDSGADADARLLTFTVPLIYGQRALGDVIIETQGMQAVRVETQTLYQELSLLLNDAGAASLTQAIAGEAFVPLDRLALAGFDVRFDRRRLALVVGTIPGEFRPVQSLGRPVRESNIPNLPILEPEPFSSYLNLNLNLDYENETDFENPELFLTGATRVGDVVVEYDGAFSGQFEEDYRFFRRGVRAVYDQPEEQRRFSAGDLRAATLPILRTPFLGGVAVEKGRRIFDPFLPVARLGAREIFLDNQSNVEVLLNGEIYQTFQLEPGRYDLSDLPVQVGANDIQLIVNDSAGRRQVVDFNFFFEPLDLVPGEEEYSLAIGAIAQNLTFEPDYSDEIGVSAFYRRAFSENLVFGGGTQLSENLQVGALTASIVPQFIPGAFDLEGAFSTGPAGTGYAFRGNYRFRSGSTFTDSRQLSINVDYESEGYQTLSDLVPVAFDLLSVSANYTQGIDDRTFLNAGAIYTTVGGRSQDNFTVFTDVVHRLNDRLRLTGGVEYGTSPFFDDDFGVRIGIAYALGGNTRANLDYRSRAELLRATVSKGAQDQVGSFGYDLGFTDARGQVSSDANVTYIGNRFEGRVLAQTIGQGIDSIFDRQTVRMQLGTSLAYTGGYFGVGRPINDSFAVLKPDPAIGDVEVISGHNLFDNRYDARSGTLGAAVQGDIISYAGQSIQYDVAGTEAGIDIGDGIFQVDPPYRSGYAVTVGSAYFISATGFLKRGAEPFGLSSGLVRSPGDEAFEPQPFFTNSAGRFAIIGLAPGGRYEVTLSSGERFAFVVPEETTNLYRLGDIVIDDASTE
ncbi:fimbria/pilus outer membrane usher protein [Erythrobacter sp.]|jgi:outer membrane usher protein|uniref:fimbria/pilus outer membrane usher protein n=1 Tax=Erythrobacter sp. TaxID=1042 RepID=UPI002EC0A52A|nr:fimbria/pilus outer membrane usher protein [Erythrobacter sp.]